MARPPAARPSKPCAGHAPRTGERVWHPLEDAEGRFYPDAADARHSHRADPRKAWRARRIVREARRHAGLGEHVTLTACRHGGMTELGDAELTEQGVMALSAHKAPEAA
jgi:hypothetical protein